MIPSPTCALRDQAADGVWIRRPGARPTAGEYGSGGSAAQPASASRRTSAANATSRARRPAMRGLRRRRVRPGGELAERERRVPEPEVGGVLERRGERVEAPLVAQRRDRLELRAGREALADEVRVVGVREPVRLGPEPRDERPLLECEHGLGRAGRRQVRLDRVPALRVRRRRGDSRSTTRMRAPSAEATLRTKAAPAWSGVRTSRCGDRGPAERAAAEEGAAQVGAERQHGRATTRPGGRSSGTCRGSSDPRLGEHVDRVPRRRRRGAGSASSPSKARRRYVRISAVDAERPQDRERTARDRRLDRRRGGTTSAPRPRRWTRARRCGRAPRSRPAGRSAASGRPRPARRGRRRRASSRLTATSLEREQAPLEAVTPTRRIPRSTARRALRRRRGGTARRARSGSRRRTSPPPARRAGARRAPRARRRSRRRPTARSARREQLPLERREPVVVDGDVVVADRRPGEVRRRTAGTDPARSRHPP